MAYFRGLCSNARNEELLHACAEGHCERVIHLVHAGTSPDGLCERKPLFVAIESEQLACVRTLYDCGASLACRDERDCTPLYCAVETANYPLIRYLLSLLRYVDDTEKPSLLTLAVNHSNIAIAKALIERGVAVDARDYEGCTPLMITVSQGRSNIEMAELLLGAHADPDAQDNRGYTAMHYAAESGGCELARVIGKNCTESSAKLKTSEWQSALDLAIRYEKIDMVDVLLELGWNPNDQDADGCTALHSAIAHNRDECVTMLLDRGASLTIADVDGDTALHIASFYERIVIPKMILERDNHSSLVGRLNRSGWSALHTAVRTGARHSVRVLLQFGAEPAQPTRSGKNAYELQTLAGNTVLIDVIEELRRERIIPQGKWVVPQGVAGVDAQ